MSLLKMIRPLLPPDLKSMVDLMLRIYGSLDTAEERKEAFDYGTKMLADGNVSVPEWSGFGKRLGMFKKKKKSSSRTVIVNRRNNA